MQIVLADVYIAGRTVVNVARWYSDDGSGVGDVVAANKIVTDIGCCRAAKGNGRAVLSAKAAVYDVVVDAGRRG